MIEMIAGVYGLPVKNGNVKTIKGMSKDSGPFEAGTEQEARLVKLGMAVYVDKPVDNVEPPELPADDIPEYSMENTVKELRAIGERYGLTFKAGMTKTEMLAALDNAANPVDEEAPTFDAAEAVQ